MTKNSLVYTTLAVAIYPATIALGVLLTLWAQAQGMAGGAIIGLVSVFTVIMIAVAERVLPFRADWNRNHGDMKADTLHNIFSSYLPRELYRSAFRALLASGAIGISATTSGGLWHSVAGAWPFAVQVMAVMVLAEFMDYWMHRISHETDFFWRFHSVHHSPLRLYWLNAGRDHPISVFFFFCVISVPLLLLGVPGDVLLMFYVLEAILGLLQHCNIDLRLGVLNWIFSTPDLHRWHHSLVVKEANSNYGSNLIIWDVIFGTRYLPHLAGPDAIGVKTPVFPRSWWEHMKLPFRWKKIV